MRSFILPLALLLSACASAAPPLPPGGSPSGYLCRQQPFEQFIGQSATSEVGRELLRASGARTIRWVRPGMMVTMEFSPERLTVRLASNDRIVAVNCG